MKLSPEFIKKVSKHTTRSAELKNKLSDNYLLCKGFLNGHLRGSKRSDINYKVLSVASETNIVINLLGYIGLGDDLTHLEKELRPFRRNLSGADFTFAITQFSKHNTQKHISLRKKLESLRLMDVCKDTLCIHSTIYKTYAGTFAVCSCMLNHPSASEIQVREELIQEYYTLKRLGADYVILYLDGELSETTPDQNQQLINLLLTAGVDDIVHVKSHESVSDVTFLSSRDNRPDGHSAIRITLRKVNGKLRVLEESPLSMQPVHKTVALKK